MVKRARGFAGTQEKPYYAIKQPIGQRKTFSVVAQWKDSGKIKSAIVKLDTVDGVNKLFLNEVLTREQALQQIKLIIANLYNERDKDLPEIIVSSQNLKLLGEYWVEEYEDRDLISHESMYNDLKRAVVALDNLSLLSVQKKELQDHLAKKFKSDNSKHRRVIDRLNQLLKYANRPFLLKKPAPSKTRVAYITFDDFKLVVANINDPIVKTISWIAFTTGLRTGEIFAASSDYLKNNKLFVDSQIDREMQVRATKNLKDRWLVVLPEGGPHLKKWLAIPEGERNKYRMKKFSELFRKACEKTFPNEPKKHITFHDLRHSYAIHLLNRGVRIVNSNEKLRVIAQ